MRRPTTTLNFGISFVTPGFLGGAPKDNGPGEPPYYPNDPMGIRIPSLRGILSFWYRSLLGDLDGQEVFKRQAKIFGSAQGGQGIIIRPMGSPDFETGKAFEDDATGLVYLGYGPLQITKTSEKPYSHANSYNGLQRRDAILPDSGEKPAFCFQARGTPEQIQELKRSLGLLHLFGGLGSRSRRGWGSVEIHTEFFTPHPEKDQDFAAWFLDLFGAAIGPGGALFPPSMDLRFSAFSRDALACRTRVCSSYREVLLTFYHCFQQVRFWNTPTGRNDITREMADAKERKNSITDPPRRLAFGLPYQAKNHHKSAVRWHVEYHGRRPTHEKPDVSRRASPLFLKVLRARRDKYVGIALFLPAQFFGDPQVQIGAKNKPLTKPFPGYDAVEEFLNDSTWTRLSLPSTGRAFP